jgi:LacI family transcriptional regulator
MLYYGNFLAEPASKIVQELIDNNALPRAIICANDNMAIATIDTLHKNDIFVPDDIIVTGFDGIRDTRYNIPPCIISIIVNSARKHYLTFIP